MLPNHKDGTSISCYNNSKYKEMEVREEETFYEVAESFADITRKITESPKIKIKKTQISEAIREVSKKNQFERVNSNKIHHIDTNISTKNTYLYSTINPEKLIDPSSNVSAPYKVIKSNNEIHDYNYNKTSLQNINLNFNINIRCQNDYKNSNVNLKEKRKSRLDKTNEKEEIATETIYETVLQSIGERENYLAMLNANIDKVPNFQSDNNNYNNNLVRNSSLFSFSEFNSNLPEIKFELDDEIDLNFFKKKLKYRYYNPKQKHFRNIVELQNFQADFQQIWIIKLSPNGEYLATGGRTGILKIFEIIGINSNKFKDNYTSEDILSYLNFISETPFRSYNHHSDDIIDICWSPRDSKVLLTASLDSSVLMWNLDYENPIQKFLHSSTVTSVSFCPIKEPDSDEYFITGCLDKYIRVWSCTTGKVISYKNIEEYITAVTYFPTGDMIAIGTHNGKCSIFDCKPDLRYSFSFLCRNRIGKYSRGEKITNIEFINKTLVLITTNDSRIRLVNISDGKMIQKYKGLLNEEFMIRSFSEDTNELVISASEDGYVYVWNRFNKESNHKKNYSYESFKPFQKDICSCSIFGSDISNTYYLKKLFNLTTKIMVHSIILNATVGGRLQVLLNCEEI